MQRSGRHAERLRHSARRTSARGSAPRRAGGSASAAPQPPTLSRDMAEAPSCRQSCTRRDHQRRTRSVSARLASGSCNSLAIRVSARATTCCSRRVDRQHQRLFGREQADEFGRFRHLPEVCSMRSRRMRRAGGRCHPLPPTSRSTDARRAPRRRPAPGCADFSTAI